MAARAAVGRVARERLARAAAVGEPAAYDPATNAWTTLPAVPVAARSEPSFVWTGTELILWGGRGASSAKLTDGWRFDPSTRAWTKFSDPGVFEWRYDQATAWDGTRMFVWGGQDSTYKANGGAYVPSVGWTAVSAVADTIFAPKGTRIGMASWAAKGKLYALWGINSYSAVTGGAVYDAATDTWSTLDMTGAPKERHRASAVWTGREAILWGGAYSDGFVTLYNDGGIYRP